MTELNATNRSVYISDNLAFLKSLNTGTIDLVCIDPPFAKNETFGRKNRNAPDPLKPPMSEQERQVELDLMARWGIHTPGDADRAGINWPETAYKDFWSWEKDVHEDWLINIQADYPAVATLIEATRQVHGDSTAAYLCYMAVRLFEIRRVLRNTGSLYLHCDHTAGAYLRQLLDGIFGNGRNGKAGFRNEIVWCYTSPSTAKRWFPRKHDTILFYAKSEDNTFNQDDVSVQHTALHGNVNSSMHIGALDSEKIAEKLSKGKVVEDYWLEKRDDMSPVTRSPTERTGYPTQKPVTLAERIIKASCPEGGVVLDCFAGCAYVAIAAERLSRQWIACDINPRAWTVFKRQFNKPQLALLNCLEPTEGQQVMAGEDAVTVHGPGELPARTSPIEEIEVPEFRVPERRFKVPASDIPEREMLEMLLELSGWKGWCCGFANRRPDGTVGPVDI